MLLVTKAVGDWFGKGGIADEMIRFNGYPFLEKDDHAFHIAGRSSSLTIALHSFKLYLHLVSRVMRKELYTMPAVARLQDVGERPLLLFR